MSNKRVPILAAILFLSMRSSGHPDGPVAAPAAPPTVESPSGASGKGHCSTGTSRSALPDDAALSYTNLPTVTRSTPRPRQSPKFGPPPPGYARIVGGVVPGWTPADMHRPVAGELVWQPLGPRPITGEVWSAWEDASGRVVSIAPHPTNPQIVYIAAASGGIWKTTDGGANWYPLTDELPVTNHGSVALDPQNPDVVYAGTGEYTVSSTGAGLFRSRDAGSTWEQIATTEQVGTTCSRVLVQPGDSQRIHVTGNYGYALSTDGGSSWSYMLAGNASDLALSANRPEVLFLGRYGDGVWRSPDRGQTWARLAGGLPTDDVRRILVAVSKSNPDVVYTAIINSRSGLRGLYKSVDRGETWVQKPNTPDFPYPQGWYDACLAVDPTNPDVVYAGGVFPSYAVAGVIKSIDGGDSWVDITIDGYGKQLHPDQHAIALGPDGTLWIGNDGGVWKSTTGGERWINTNATLTVTQNYQIALHPADPAQIMGGTQDNGTVERNRDDEDWPQMIGGDGGFLEYDRREPARQYTTYVNLTVFRRDPSWNWVNITGPWGNDRRLFIAPLVMDPTDPETLYGGTDRVWRTRNASTGAFWEPISGKEVGYGTALTCIGISPADPNTIYVGAEWGGSMFVTRDGGGQWVNRSAGMPQGATSDIVVDPRHAGRAYVCVFFASEKRIARTTDYGQTWENVTGTLPASVRCTALEIDWRVEPPGIFVGSGAGVYWSYDDGQTWTKDGTDLPNVNIGDLRIDLLRETITAGTYGRGVWRAALPRTRRPGDLNCDGAVDFGDITPFVLALSDPEEYKRQYPNCNILNGDCNNDGRIDFGDINPFVELLSGS